VGGEKVNRILFSHNSDEWETPQALFDELNSKYGFTLDPCATNKNKKVNYYFNKKQNGLSQTWRGHRVFVNPPYSNIKEWVFKCFKEYITAQLVVLLVPARTDTKWFHNYIYKQPDVEIRFIKGRLKFGKSKNCAPFPSMLVIFDRYNAAVSL